MADREIPVGAARDALADVEHIARAAGALLMSHFGHLATVEKKGWNDLVTVADREAEALVIDWLARAYPGDAVLAEETRASQAMAPRLWILDPLDGTTNFVHRIPHFAVSLALYVDGVASVACVFNPRLDECYTAARGRGAWLNGAPIHAGTAAVLSDALLCTGFHYRMGQKVDNNLQNFFELSLRARGMRRLGSAALDLCYVADGRYDAFWELHLSPWDVAAGTLIAREAGCVVSDLKGGEDWLFGGNLIAGNAAIHTSVMAVLAAVRH